MLRATLLVLLVAAAIPAGAAAQDVDPLDAVAVLVRERQDEAALRAFDALPRRVRDESRARYLRGRLLERLGRQGEAAEAYLAALRRGGLPGPVGEDARSRRAATLARSGRCSDARALLSALGTLRANAGRARVGDCALTHGDPRRAIEDLRLVARADGVDTFVVRLQLAQALLATGDRSGAIRELSALYVERPDHSRAAEVTAELERLHALPRLSGRDHIERAEKLSDGHRYQDAADELEHVRTPRDRATRARFLHARGMALFNTRHHYPEAARVLASASSAGGDNAASDLFYSGRALSRSGHDTQAIAVYRRVVRRFPRERVAAEAEFLAAWLELRLDRRGGPAHMETVTRSERARRNPEWMREALWSLAFYDFEHEAFARAAPLFERYAQTADGALVRARGLYWTGRAKAALSDRAGAIASYRAALAIEPLHWYALLSRARLVELGETVGDPFGGALADAHPSAPLVLPRLPGEVELYSRLGLREDAVAALKRNEASFREAAPRDRDLEALVRAYHSLGEVARPYRLVASMNAEVSRPPGPSNRWVWEAAYPRPYRDLVAAEARARGLPDENYLYAIMRQESGYDPRAVSYADAVGLLQLLPSTSRRVARGLGLPHDRDMLFDPRYNIRVGAAYSGTLFGAFGRIAPLSIGAYNAGGHRLRQWLGDGSGDEQTGEIELDRFVERIPVDQTRNYIRRVVSHWARYRYLADPSHPWPIDLPPRISTAIASSSTEE